MTPDQLREEAWRVERFHQEGFNYPVEVTDYIKTLRANAAAIEEVERLKKALYETSAKLGRVEGHAEAMATQTTLEDRWKAIEAYRADKGE